MPRAKPRSPLVLASASPRRRQLLEQLGLRIEVFPVDVDETIRPRESGRRAVRRLAETKALAARERMPNRTILAADTLVCVEDVLLGKPTDRKEARAMLRDLSNRWHDVYSGVALVTAGGKLYTTVARTRVRFAELTKAEIENYTDGEEPYDKAGGYAIQGIGGWFVREIRGSHSNVIGLPLDQVRDLLKQARFPTPPLR